MDSWRECNYSDFTSYSWRVWACFLVCIANGLFQLYHLFDPFSIVPMVMVSFFVLKEVLVFENGTVPEPFHLRVIFQMVILICLAVPTIMLYTTQEVRRIKREEFMMAATVLGEVIGIE